MCSKKDQNLKRYNKSLHQCDPTPNQLIRVHFFPRLRFQLILPKRARKVISFYSSFFTTLTVEGQTFSAVMCTAKLLAQKSCRKTIKNEKKVGLASSVASNRALSPISTLIDFWTMFHRFDNFSVTLEGRTRSQSRHIFTLRTFYDS